MSRLTGTFQDWLDDSGTEPLDLAGLTGVLEHAYSNQGYGPLTSIQRPGPPGPETGSMTSTALDRKAVTIVAADLVGYSRMMAEDEDLVIARLRDVREKVIDPALAAEGGRIIKTMGDGLLVEFIEPSAAVRAAVAVQESMVRRSAGEPEHAPMQFRIGVNHGHVVIDGDDVLGDVVNIAARLESIAPPGGVCVSRTVHDEVAAVDGLQLRPMGPQFVKNIPVPVETWCVEIDGVATNLSSSTLREREQRASVAVLAFENLSADPEQAYLADGIAEDVTAELARFRSLFVVARSSSFSYKNSRIDVRRIARELGVRYVVTGSVRRVGDRVRASAQLVEAETGVQVWTNRWDRDLSKLFELQDDITHAIITGLAPELGAHERQLARRKPTESLNSWELTQRGLSELQTYTALGYLNAYELLHAAAAADPGFALPRALLARWHAVLIFAGRSGDPAGDIEAGLEHALAARELDDRLEDAHIGLSMVYSASGRMDESLEAFTRALALNDNHPSAYQAEGFYHLYSRPPDPDGMVRAAQQSLAVSPSDPLTWAFHWMIALAGWVSDGQLTDAVREPLEAACRLPRAEFFVLMSGAVLKLRSGDASAAQRLLDRAKERQPMLSKKLLVESFHFPSWAGLARTVDEDLDAMAELGLPLE